MNKRVHNTIGIRSTNPTSSASIELQVLSFWLEYVEYGCPFLRLMVPHVCPQKSSCNPYDKYIHHLITMVPWASSVSGKNMDASRYLMVCCNLFQSYISVSCNHVNRTDTAVWIYVLSLLDRYSGLATRWWNRLLSSLFSFLLFLSTSNRWLVAGVSAHPWNSYSYFPSKSCM